MSKRIKELGAIAGGIKSSMQLAVETTGDTGVGTIAECFKTMVNQGALAKHGGASFNISADDELVLDHSINIPAQNNTTGGSVNLWLSEDYAITLDTFKDVNNLHAQGANNHYFRIHGKNQSGSDIVLFGVDTNTGDVYKGSGPGSSEMVPLTSGSSDELNAELASLRKRISDLENSKPAASLVHVDQTPLPAPVKGNLWWDTNTATLYVYEGAAWVQANIGAGYPGSTPSSPSPEPPETAPIQLLRINSQTGVHDNANITILARDGSTVSGFVRSCWTGSASNQDESGVMVFDFDTTSKILNISQTWSGGSGYNNKKGNTLTLTSTAQSCGINLQYSGIGDIKAAYTAEELIFSNGSHRGVWSADEYYYESSTAPVSISGSGDDCINNFALGVTVATARAGRGIPGHVKTLLPTLTNIQVQRTEGGAWEPLQHDPYTPKTSTASQWVDEIPDGARHGSDSDDYMISRFPYIGGLRNWEFWGPPSGSGNSRSGNVAPFFKSDQGLFKAHATGSSSSADFGDYSYICEELYPCN